ncbi:hypothetical protein RY27_04115, partial [Litorilinea aerophila]
TNPMVMPVAEQTGNYGGTFRRGFRGVSDRWGPTKLQDRGLAWYDQELNMRPRIAESWEINEDASEWTFHLREGMKWSDGQPFTTADIQWWYDYELTNTEITPAPGDAWVTVGLISVLTPALEEEDGGLERVELLRLAGRLGCKAV